MMIIDVPDRMSPEFRSEWGQVLNRAMREACFADCEETIIALRTRFPNIAGFARDQARVAHRKGDFWATASAWTEFCELSPVPPEGTPLLYAQAYVVKEAVLDGIRMAIGDEFEVLNDQVRFGLTEGRYEQAERQALGRFLEAGDRVLECGAGAGYMGINAQKLFPGLTYTAVEANPGLLPLIDTNQRLNNVEFEVLSGAVGACDGEVSFLVYENFMASQSAACVDEVEPSSELCPEVRREVIVSQFGLNGLLQRTAANCLIMDIEGAEYESLLAADLAGVNKLLVEVHPAVLGRKRVTELLSYLLDKGFEVDLEICSNQVFCFFRKEIKFNK